MLSTLTPIAVAVAALVTIQRPEAPAQPTAQPAPPAPAATPVPAARPSPLTKAPSKDELDAAAEQCVKMLMGMQETLANSAKVAEGDDAAAAPEKGEWPYEGVYRVNRQIPIGYRVGGTAIAALALVRAPGYAEDATRQQAVERAVRFVCVQREHTLMSTTNYAAGYDVRAWGYIYAVELLSELAARDQTPPAVKDEAARALEWYVKALHALEMPETGGWNYARPEGRDTVGAPSPFMTAPALQALFLAKSVGQTVDPQVVERGLVTLEKSRTLAGAVNYSGFAGGRREDLVPGAVGRMLAVETTLVLAGRGSVPAVRASLDAFLVHWKWLEARRQQQGTHVGPYGVAPYYFMYAHAAAAQAIELLPRAERTEYRKRLLELMFSVRDADGSWNDRVFKRTANYGTACALGVITQPVRGPGVAWKP